MKKRLPTFLLLLQLSSSAVWAQYNEVLNPNIASLQVVAGDDWLSMPVVDLDGGTPINIAFDDLTHEYHRYAYRIEHCNADWSTTTDLFQSDYCQGFADGNTIDDATESLQTNTLYTHYQLQIPNDRCRLRLSGNYRLTVYDENTNEDALSVCFMVNESAMSLRMEGSTNTDIDINGRHQQLSLMLDYGSQRVTNPQNEIKTLVLQNGRFDNAVVNPKYQYTMANGLKWEHNRQLIFDGGNEYRKFETLDVDHSTLGIETMHWDGTNYNAYVWTDEPRHNYVYDEDANGCFFIRNGEGGNNDTESEYLYVHFRLKAPRQSGSVYLNGVWTLDQLLSQYEMTYNELEQQYEATVFLKQGYYSYQYLLQRADGSTALLPSEGNFSQTENKYQWLVYYRSAGSRYDRLVGFGELQLK